MIGIARASPLDYKPPPEGPARAVAKANGLTWHWIDPVSTSWKLEPIFECLQQEYHRSGSYGSLAVAHLLQIEKQIDGEYIVLSGFFGDAITGGIWVRNLMTRPAPRLGSYSITLILHQR